MEHQDWTPVVLKKKQAQDKQTILKSSAATITSSEKPAWKIEKQVDSEEGKPLNFVSSDIAKLIIGGRISAKLSQKQLAQKLNIQEKEIKDIETCKAVENKALISKIKRALNI